MLLAQRIWEAWLRPDSGFLDDREKFIAQMYLQKAAQAADEVVQGHNGPTVANPTTAEIEQNDPTSQQEDDGDEITFVTTRKGRLDAPHLQAHLSRLSDRKWLATIKKAALLAKGARQQVAMIEDFVPHSCLI